MTRNPLDPLDPRNPVQPYRAWYTNRWYGREGAFLWILLALIFIGLLFWWGRGWGGWW